MHIDDAIQTHLPQKYADAFTHAATDRSVFLQGVNYRFEDHVWNIRLSMKGEEGLFLRAHSSSTIYGEFCKQVSPNSLLLKTLYQDSETFHEGDFSIEKTFAITKCFYIHKILTQGTLLTDHTAPQVISDVAQCAQEFFRSCPELIPQVDSSLPSATWTPSSSDRGLTFTIEQFSKILLTFLVACLLYKLASSWLVPKAD